MLATFLGVCAVLAGSAAITPLIIGHSWLLPVVEVVAIVWLVGVGGRLLAVPAAVIVALQAIGIVIAATSLFLSSGIAGVLPGPAALGEGRELLTGAWEEILRTAPPADASPGMELLLTLLIGLVALVVDVLIAEVRAPALVALPLLALYSVPASIARDMLPWYTFVAPAVAYAALLAVSRGAADRRPTARMAGSTIAGGTAIAAIAIVGALLLADSTTAIGTEGRIPRGGHGPSDVGVSPWALLRGDLRQQHPVDTLRVTGLDQPAYLRTFSLDKWEAGRGFVLGGIDSDDADVTGALPDAPDPDDRSETVTITPQSYRAKYLPIYLGTTSLGDLSHSWDYDRKLETVFRTTPVTPEPYTVVANIGPVSAAELRTEDVHSDGPLTDSTGVPDQVVSLAKSLTRNADSPFDAVERVLDYFTNPANGFTYSLTTAEGNSGDALLDFLTNKQGYCEQYAAAMTIMLRTVGIPARVGIGFTQGTRQADGSYQITSTNAHAWVEVRFDGAGWVSFDPTPSASGQGGLQGFTENESPGGGAGEDGAATSESSPPSTSASAEQDPLDDAVPDRGQIIPDASDEQPRQAAEATASGAWGAWLSWVLIGIAAFAVAVALIGGPAWVRSRRRRSRLAAATAGRHGAGAAAWDEITDSMIDHGMAPEGTSSARRIANELARATHLTTADRTELRAVVMAAEREWYGSSDGHDEDLAPGVRTVIDGLRRARPLTALDHLLPRSLRRSRME